MTVHVRVLSLATMVAAAVCIAACGDDDPSAPVVPTETFRATLSGAKERPTPRVSNGTGTAELVLFGNDSISFDVKIGQIDSVRLSHIHAGDTTQAGSIIFGWPDLATPTNFPTLVQFQLGMIRRTSTFSGIFAANGFDSLVTRLRAGTAYVNVHTVRFGAGEIRGNLVKQ